MSEYKSPIQIWFSELSEFYEDEVLKAVQKYKIDVDKTELIKALKYDRGQYDKGYEDGYKAKDLEILRCRDCKWYIDNTTVEASLKYCRWRTDENPDDDDFCSLGERIEEHD